jgi:oligopeptidase A
VKNSEELREEKQKVQALVVECSTLVPQSKPLYEALKRLQKRTGKGLNQSEGRIVDGMVTSAELGGVALEGEAKETFNTIQKELAELSTKFSNNVLDATKAYSLVLTDKSQVAGFPPSLLALTAQAQAQADPDAAVTATESEGPWRVTLDGPCFVALLRFAEDPELREKVYKAYISKASEASDGSDSSDSSDSNMPIINRILELRRQKATLLGYNWSLIVVVVEYECNLLLVLKFNPTLGSQNKRHKQHQ